MKMFKIIFSYIIGLIVAHIALIPGGPFAVITILLVAFKVNELLSALINVYMSSGLTFFVIYSLLSRKIIGKRLLLFWMMGFLFLPLDLIFHRAFDEKIENSFLSSIYKEYAAFYSFNDAFSIILTIVFLQLLILCIYVLIQKKEKLIAQMALNIKMTIFICLFFLLFFSCRVKQDCVEGVYSKIYKGTKHVPSSRNILLNEDNSFSYYFSSGWIKEVSYGYWCLKGKNIILDSYIQDMENIPLIIHESKNNNYSSPIFILDNFLKEDTLIKWTLNINGIDYLMNADTLIFEKEIAVDSFYIKGHKDFTNLRPFPLHERLQSQKYKVMNSSNNIYYINFPEFINYDIYHYKIIRDTLSIIKNRLYWHNKRIKLRKQI